MLSIVRDEQVLLLFATAKQTMARCWPGLSCMCHIRSEQDPDDERVTSRNTSTIPSLHDACGHMVHHKAGYEMICDSTNETIYLMTSLLLSSLELGDTTAYGP